MIALHIILAMAACFALWRAWIGIARNSNRIAARIIAAGFLLRAFAGQALFWISWLRLPIARSLQLGEGYWAFAVDSPGYMTYAKHFIEGHPAAHYPARVFVHVLGAFIGAFGFFTSVAVLLNCALYLATCALIAFIGRGARMPVLVALAAIAFGPGTVLWSLQPLKDTPLLSMLTAAIAVCFVWQEATTIAPRVGSALAMLVLLYTIATLRWYFAIFLTICWAIFALIVALKAKRKIPLLLGSATLLVPFAVSVGLGSSWDAPALFSIERPPAARLEKLRRGFQQTEARTVIVPGPALAPAKTSIIAATAMMFLPHFIVEPIGLAHVSGQLAFWVFAETDTLAFDAVLVFAIVCSIRARRGITPLSIMLLSLFVITAVPLMYVVNNFGTLFRLRQMLYLIAAVVPLTLSWGSGRILRSSRNVNRVATMAENSSSASTAAAG